MEPQWTAHWYDGQESAKADTAFAEAFRKGLSEVGFAEGKNVTINFRWAGP